MSRLEGGLRFAYTSKETSKDLPLISIISVVYNAKNQLERTIKSVLDQTYKNIEYIIIDGGSTDGTLEIIYKYESRIDYWISEKDHGIYDAMNKGISQAHGCWIGILNADDKYYKNSVQSIVDVLRQNKNADIIYSDVNYKISETIIRLKAPRKLSFEQFWKMPLYHPASFISMNAYASLGHYSTAYSLSSDYEFIVRALKKSAKFLYIETVLTEMCSGGASYKNCIKALNELYAIAKSHRIVTIPFKLNFFVALIKAVFLQKYCGSGLFLRAYKRYKK